MTAHTTCYTHQRTARLKGEKCRTCNRLAMERRIVLRTAKALLRAGYAISVNDGEDTTLRRSTDLTAITAALFTTDEDWLLAHRDGQPRSFVRFIYGNSGHDVINNYGVSLEPIMAPINKWCDTLDTGR